MFRSRKQEREENYTRGTRNYDVAMVRFYDQECIKRQRRERVFNFIFAFVFIVLFGSLIALFVWAILFAV